MSTQQILSQVLSLGIANESDIIIAIHKVNDKRNVQEIVNYLLDTQHKQNIKQNNDGFYDHYDECSDMDISDDDNYQYETVVEYYEVTVDEDGDDAKDDRKTDLNEFEDDQTQQQQIEPQQLQDFWWKCHKCDTWFVHT